VQICTTVGADGAAACDHVAADQRRVDGTAVLDERDLIGAAAERHEIEAVEVWSGRARSRRAGAARRPSRRHLRIILAHSRESPGSTSSANANHRVSVFSSLPGAKQSLEGRNHAEKKAELAERAKAASIRIVHFTELPEKGDVSDFIVNGGTAEKLRARIDATPEWLASGNTIESQDELPSQASRQDWRSRIFMANDLQSMTFPPVRYILPGYIPEGATWQAKDRKVVADS
jgi:hypothetical protein